MSGNTPKILVPDQLKEKHILAILGLWVTVASLNRA